MAFVNTNCGRRQKEVAQLSCPQLINPPGLQNVASSSSVVRNSQMKKETLSFRA